MGLLAHPLARWQTNRRCRWAPVWRVRGRRVHMRGVLGARGATAVEVGVSCHWITHSFNGRGAPADNRLRAHPVQVIIEPQNVVIFNRLLGASFGWREWRLEVARLLFAACASFSLV